MNETRGINKMKDAPTTYKSHVFDFVNKNDANRYNSRMKYDYTAEAKRILNGMRGTK